MRKFAGGRSQRNGLFLVPQLWIIPRPISLSFSTARSLCPASITKKRQVGTLWAYGCLLALVLWPAVLLRAGIRRTGGMRTSPFHLSESAPGSPRAVTPVPTKTEEVSNLKTLPKGLSASLPDLDSENWIEVKKRPRPSPARPKVGDACPLPWGLGARLECLEGILYRQRALGGLCGASWQASGSES